MDPSPLLDHALFHLTPTRTRCDLFAVPAGGGGAREKIASGLVEPFLAHLRSARELLPKGGYSFALRPAALPAPWFSRATLERFVRFVASPEILERAVIIEKELVQIDDSVRKEDLPLPLANGAAKKPSAAPSKVGEDLGKEDEVQEENSKTCLVRVLENRKMMLLKEQGMAYARASVAGYEKGNIDNLISFADAFGADRLRDACINFKELCKEKEQDKLWMDELAALEASRVAQLSYLGGSGSGVMLTSEVNAESQQEQNGADDSVRAHMTNGAGSIPWNSAPYMYNFQNPGFPGSAPFPGYAFPYPGMQMIPPYPGYGENFHWPYRGDEKDVDGSRSRGMPEKLHRSAETTRSSRDAYSEDVSSNSESEPEEHHVSTDADSSRKSHRPKRSKKKSSRTVVIRNINYISKGRHGEDDDSNGSSGEDDNIDGDSLRREVEDIVGSFGKHQNSIRHQGKNKGDRRKSGGTNVSTENDDKVKDDDTSPRNSKEKKTGGGWDAFQSLLMREESHSDELDQGIKDTRVEGNKLQQADIAGEYCTMKNGEIMPSSTARYQLHNELEKGTKPKLLVTDPLMETKMGAISSGNGSLGNFEPTESNGHIIRRTHNAGDDILFSERTKTEMNTHEALSNIGDESSTYRGRRDSDWFIVSGSEGQFAREGSRGHMIFDGEKFVRTENNDVHKERTRSDIAVDDSFIAPVRDVVVEEQSSSLWGTDINIISGAAASGPKSTVFDKSKETRKPEFYEPEELLVLERHTEVEDMHASWNPEIEFRAEVTHAIIEEKKPVIVEAEATNPVDEKPTPSTKSTKIKNPVLPKTSPSSRLATKNKLEALSRPKTIPTINRKGTNMSKSAKEEAERKRIEEIRMERERRIAERSATMGSGTASKVNSTDRRTSLGKSPASQPTKQHGFGYGVKFSAEKVTAK